MHTRRLIGILCIGILINMQTQAYAIWPDFKQIGTQLIVESETTGNAWLAKAGNEASIVGQTLEYALRKDLDRNVDKVSEQGRGLLTQLDKFNHNLKSYQPTFYDLKDTAIVDINNLISYIPRVGNRKNHFLQAVKGIAFLPKESGDYKMTVIASSIDNRPDYQSNVELKINGSLVTPSRVEQNNQHGLINIFFPVDTLKAHFKDKELATVPAELTIVSKERVKSLFGEKWVESRYPYSIWLILYPHVAGQARLEYVNKGYGWRIVQRRSIIKTTKDAGEDGRAQNYEISYSVPTHVPPVPGSQRIVSARLRCIDPVMLNSSIKGPCHSKYGRWRGEGKPMHGYRFRKVRLDNGTSFPAEAGPFNETAKPPIPMAQYSRAYATFDFWARNPVTFELLAEIEEWREIDLPPAEKYKAVEADMEYGSTLEFVVPERGSYQKIKVKTYSGETYDLVVGQSDSKGLLEYKGIFDDGPGQKELFTKLILQNYFERRFKKDYG